MQRAVQDGRIHLEEDGKIDPERADREWIENTDPARKLPENAKLLEQRMRKAKIDADRAQIELDERRGKLVSVDGMTRRWFEVSRRTRDRLMSVGARLAGTLAQETDAREVHRIIDDEIAEALAGLSQPPHGNGKG